MQKKTLGEPSTVINEDGLRALEFNAKNASVSAESSQIAKPTKYVMAAARDDGLVREEKNNRIVKREDTTELTEVEDVRHFGDFSDAVSHYLFFHVLILMRKNQVSNICTHHMKTISD